jgi:ribosomal protein S18 acetylase RimI-like enzyme
VGFPARVVRLQLPLVAIVRHLKAQPVTVLRPMTDSEYADWVAEAIPAYAHDKVASGQWSAEAAIELSTNEHHELLPAGLQTPDNFLFTIEDDAGRAVGMLWFAVQIKFSSRIAYVFDVSIRPERQRQGHAFQAFRALEAEVKRQGLTGIALHVFGHNAGAQALYARLGFQPTNISLFKPVVAAGA